jgi:hypothetical protein
MPQYFDPMQSMNALAGGAQMGGAIRDKQTSNALAPMVAKGDYKGAMEYAGSRGDLGQVDAMRTQYQGQLTAEQESRRKGVLQVGMSLLQTPVEQRDPMKVSQSLAQFGIEVDPAQFSDLSDASIQRVMTSAQDTAGLEAQYAEMMKQPEYTSTTGADGRPMSFNKGTGLYGDPVGDAKPAPNPDQATDALGRRKYSSGPNTGEIVPGFGDPNASSGGAGGAGEYGLSPIYGRDADGNRILIQTNKGGGVRQAGLPEGVTLEDDRYKSSARALGTAEGKKEAYRTEAGMAVLAAQDKTDLMTKTIDSAIEKSDFWNTGITGKAIWSPDFNALLDSIGANAMLSELLELKKQGGTLGALSEGEGKALRAAAVNITRSQSEKQLDDNLTAYRTQLELSMTRIKNAYEQDYQSGMYDGSPPAPQQGGQQQAGGGVQYEKTATNPETGQKIGLLDGKWVAIQ